jgi:hypothetical protein
MRDLCKRVIFKNKSFLLEGKIYFPKNFNDSYLYKTVVIVGSGSNVKEQATAIYAKNLSGNDLITFIFDPSFMGNSSGEPRYLEDPLITIEDIKCAADYLMTLSYVDEHNLCLLGIGSGGGYAVNAAMTDYRFSSLATVVGLNIGSSYRKILGRENVRKAIMELSTQRTLQARGGKKLYAESLDGSMGETKEKSFSHTDLIEAIRFHRECEMQHNDPFLLISLSHILGFDSFHMLSELLIQPLLVVVADDETTESYKHGMQLFYMASSEIKNFSVIEGAKHYEMYSNIPTILKVIAKLSTFYNKEY